MPNCSAIEPAPPPPFSCKHCRCVIGESGPQWLRLAGTQTYISGRRVRVRCPQCRRVVDWQPTRDE